MNAPLAAREARYRVYGELFGVRDDQGEPVVYLLRPEPADPADPDDTPLGTFAQATRSLLTHSSREKLPIAFSELHELEAQWEEIRATDPDPDADRHFARREYREGSL